MIRGLAEALTSGDRRALARAITLVESTRADDRTAAGRLLDSLVDRTGGSIRLGVTGTPGAGKSTLIESLGLLAIERGRRVAVLAVDPSSSRTGGSVLGDKTRMGLLSQHPNAFIRPSPSRGSLGGVARRTGEAMLLCEAAGFDLVLIETVGVGQSEVAVAQIVDLFLLVASPAGGDELQGIKRGIMELADLIVVNKADGDFATAARRTAGDLRSALHLARPKRPGWLTDVLVASALEHSGLAELWEAIEVKHASIGQDLPQLRADQSVEWMRQEISDLVLDRALGTPEVKERMRETEHAVRRGDLSPAGGATRVLETLDLSGAGGATERSTDATA